MKPALPFMSRAHIALAAAALSSCTYQVSKDWKNYEPGPAQAYSSKLKVGVAPLADKRFVFTRLPGYVGWHFDPFYLDSPIHPDWQGMKELRDAELPGLYSQWLLKDLRSSGIFADVRPVTWEELARGEDLPDLVISGDLRVDGMRNIVNWALALPSVLTFTLLPANAFFHFMEIELYAFDPRKPAERVWSYRGERTLRESQSKILKTPWYFYCKAVDQHREMVKPIYTDARASLAKTIAAGGRP